jgi:hypothetical protein
MESYREYTILEKFDILGQGINFTIDLFYAWLDIMFNNDDNEYGKQNLFYLMNGEYFYNAIALEDEEYYIWRTSNWARNYPFNL